VLVRIPFWLAFWLDAGTWATWSVVTGLVGARWPDRRLAHDGMVTTLRRAEHQGRLYRHLGIRIWKRALPDLGRFGGGRSKRPGRTRDAARWEQLLVDTRRAELVHWAVVAALPVVLIWSGGVLALSMIAYALAANLPCVAAQRYNRARLTALADRSAQAADRTPGARSGPQGPPLPPAVPERPTGS
jgi:glycosyl-4,4'-diaponeurosporenoate acyltransferase